MTTRRALLPALCGFALALVVRPGRAQTAPQKAPRFEAEIAAYEAADRQSPPPSGAVLFIGSSSIRLWKTLAKDFPELTVINRGFGGSIIRESTAYAPRIVFPYKPKTIVMYAGGNDIHGGITPEQVCKDFQAFVTTVHSALPDTRIIYISINPSTSRWADEPRDLEANRLISDYVRANDGKVAKLSYLDSHSKLLSTDGKARPEILRPDGLHLNTDGYALWTQVLKPQLLAIINQDKK